MMSAESGEQTSRGGTADALAGLVRENKDVARGRLRRICAWTAVLIFLGVITATALTDILFPAPPPALVGREKEQEEQLRADAHLRDGSLARMIERDIRQSSRVRQAVVPSYAWALYDWLGETRGFTIAGADGWFFLPSRVDTDPRSTEEHAALAGRLVGAVHRRLRALGTQLLLAPIPRKAVVYQEALPASRSPRPQLYPALVAEMRRRQIPVVDLLTPFRENRSEKLFFRMDTHWAARGELLAAEHIARALGLLVSEDERETSLRRGRVVDEPGDILRQLGIRVEKGKRPAGMKWPTHRHIAVEHPERGILRPRFTTDDLAALVLTGTSYSANRNFGLFISHYTNRPVSVAAWAGIPSAVSLGRAMRAALDQQRMPDHVIWELPTFEIFCPKIPLHDLGEFFSEIPPPRVSVLASHGGVKGAAFFQAAPLLRPGKHRVEGRHLGAWLRQGAVQHSGDGVIALRLRGRVSGGDLRILAGSTSFAFLGRWRPGVQEVVLPIISQQPTDTGFVLVSSPGAPVDLELEALEVVTPLATDTLVAARVAQLERDGDGWSQAASFALPQEVPELGALVVQMGARGFFDGTLTVAVFVKGQPSPAFTSQLEKVGPLTSVVLDMSALSGQRVDRVVVSGSGSSLEQAISVAGIVMTLP